MSEPVPGTGVTGAVPTSADDGTVHDAVARLSPEQGASESPVTGDPAVDEALRTLDGLEDADLRTQADAFDAVHGALQDRLADAEG